MSGCPPLQNVILIFNRRQIWTAGRPVQNILCVFEATLLSIVQNESIALLYSRVIAMMEIYVNPKFDGMHLYQWCCQK